MFPNPPLAIGRKRVFDSVFPPSPLCSSTFSFSSLSPTLHNDASSTTTTSGSSDENGANILATPLRAIMQSPRAPLAPPSPSSPSPSSDAERTLLQQQQQQEAAKLADAWRTATRFLSFADDRLVFDGRVDAADDESLRRRWWWSGGQKRGRALLAREALVCVVGTALGEERLLEWYMNEIRRHFLANFRDAMVEELKRRGQEGVLPRIIRFLRLAHSVYYAPFVNHVLPALNSTARSAAFSKVQQCLASITIYSIPHADFSYLLAEELATESLIILAIHNDNSATTDCQAVTDGMDVDQCNSVFYKDWKHEPSAARRASLMQEYDSPRVTAARERLLGVLQGVQEVGLGGNRAQKVFAEVMNNLITEFVAAAYAGEWDSRSLVIEHLQQWVENIFARLVVQVLHIFRPAGDDSGGNDDENSTEPDDLVVAFSDVEKWKEIGLARLGALRISELFEIIVEWESSAGAIEDLKHYTTNPSTRFYLTSSFSATLMNRLLHPGASTVDILQLYISIIRAFTQLDPKGVLLDRVARPIRRYLREREDTVKVIVSGLLTNTVGPDGQPVESAPDSLGELSVELSKAQQLSLPDDSGELDWDDMNWAPDPADAAPDYKRSRHFDIIGSLVSLFESKDVFVTELQQVLGDRLIQKKKDYDLEISVLELLKLRFGESSLHACDVMMRDVVDSKRVDTVIRADQRLECREEHTSSLDRSLVDDRDDDVPEIHAKILSRLFWPSLPDDKFRVPDEIAALQGRYSAGFETLKPSRKLTWLNGLGTVTVELDLEDRVFRDEVTPLQASVIYAFQGGPDSSGSSPVTKSIGALATPLETSAALVRSACLFWAGKRILVETAGGTFGVLERLPDEDDHDRGGGGGGGEEAADSGAGSAAMVSSAAEAEAARAAEAEAKMNVYWQFIVGMLTNQGAMPLGRIIMMLKMVVPGGIPFGSEELKEFLGQRVAQGRLRMVGGGNYKLVV
ncbi:hypothetical protein LOZ36_006860 [Ophidiomyces ophidiicola]|nr:hypothetical protein LOZ36_006860 [Ophidiomyces ophidiicola]